VVRKTQHDDATVLFRRVLRDVGKIQVSCQQRISGLTGALCDLSIRSRAEPDVSGKLDVMPRAERVPIADRGMLASSRKRMCD